MKPIFILAHNILQARDYQHFLGLTDKEVCILVSPRQLYGCHKPLVIELEGAYVHSDYVYIGYIIKERKCIHVQITLKIIL